MIKKDGLNFVHLYFLNCTCYVNNLHNIWKKRYWIFFSIIDKAFAYCIIVQQRQLRAKLLCIKRFFAFVSSLKLSRRLMCSVRFVLVSTFNHIQPHSTATHSVACVEVPFTFQLSPYFNHPVYIYIYMIGFLCAVCWLLNNKKHLNRYLFYPNRLQ